MDYINLYFKSEYSLSNSVNRLESSLVLHQESGYSAVALVDDGNLYAAHKFFRICQRLKLKSIIGMEITYTDRSYGAVRNANLLLYALNITGYNNLVAISSFMKLNPGELTLEKISKWTLGVLVIIPPSHPDLARLMNNQPVSDIEYIKSLFYECYIGMSSELCWHKEEARKLTDSANRLNIEIAALHQTCYESELDQDAYELLRRINNPDCYEINENRGFLKPKEISDIFSDFPEALEVASRIGKAIYFDLRFIDYQNADVFEYLIPEFQEKIDPVDYLSNLSSLGLAKRLKQSNIPTNQWATYQERLNYELKVINEMKFADYFLIVWNIIKYARVNKILVGPGRGSSPASLVSYSLGITEIDPIKSNLLFERFLNPGRVTMPDIDLDFPDDRREEVINYVRDRYGKNRVAYINTFDCFKAKSAITEVAKVMQLPEMRLDELLRSIPNNVSLSKATEENGRTKQLIKEFSDVASVVAMAKKLEGLPRHISRHAAAIIIAPRDIMIFTPIEMEYNGTYQTQIEATDLESLGLLKIDFLGLRNLSVINNCLEKVRHVYPSFVFPREYNDLKTFRYLSRGETTGIFQLDSYGMRNLIKEMKIQSFTDISCALALYRPGPMDMIPSFIARKNGEEPVTYLHPLLKPILEETYGTILYQEQIMMILRSVAGYSYGEADLIRRAIGKKDRYTIENEKTRFLDAAERRGVTRSVADSIYQEIAKFAAYGFNKAHSVAYSVITYHTAFLKINYPAYYISSLLDNIVGSSSEIENLINEAKELGVTVHSPSILESSFYNTVKSDSEIILGLCNIRGSSQSKYDIISIREGGFKGYEDFVLKTKDILNNQHENYIFSGALDCFGLTKRSMAEKYHKIIEYQQFRTLEGLLDIKYDDDEYSYGELSSKERFALGFNLSFDLLSLVMKQNPQVNFSTIKQVQPNNYYCLAGRIDSIYKTKTKRGEEMAFLKLSANSSVITLTCFPEAWAGIENLEVGRIVLVAGIGASRNNETQLTVQKLTIFT